MDIKKFVSKELKLSYTNDKQEKEAEKFLNNNNVKGAYCFSDKYTSYIVYTKDNRKNDLESDVFKILGTRKNYVKFYEDVYEDMKGDLKEECIFNY